MASNSASDNGLNSASATGPQEWTTVGVALPAAVKAALLAECRRLHITPSVYCRLVILQALEKGSAT